MYQERWCAIEEMVVELFAWLKHAPEYDRNPKARLIAWICKVEHGPEESPASIGLD